MSSYIYCDGRKLYEDRAELLEDGTFYSYSINKPGSEIAAIVYRQPNWEHGPWKRYLDPRDALHDYANWIGNTDLAWEAMEANWDCEEDNRELIICGCADPECKREICLDCGSYLSECAWS